MFGSHSLASWTIDPIGARVLSWTPAGGRDVLFTSTEGESPFNHGGIPICAPWFGKGRDEVSVPRSHGLVKWVEWTLIEESVTDDRAFYAWEVDSAALADQPGAENYPDDLHYRYTVTITDKLAVELTITSPTSEVVIDHAFHTYFAITDLANIEITGLEGTRTRDYATGGLESVGDARVAPRDYHDTIYFGIGDEITLADTDRTILIRPTGMKDAIVWNPGPEHAARTAGMTPDDWRHFLCIETGNVQRHAITLSAGTSLTVGMDITCLV